MDTKLPAWPPCKDFLVDKAHMNIFFTHVCAIYLNDVYCKSKTIWAIYSYKVNLFTLKVYFEEKMARKMTITVFCAINFSGRVIWRSRSSKACHGLAMRRNTSFGSVRRVAKQLRLYPCPWTIPSSKGLMWCGQTSTFFWSDILPSQSKVPVKDTFLGFLIGEDFGRFCMGV